MRRHLLALAAFPMALGAGWWGGSASPDESASLPPVVIATVPLSGAEDIDAGLDRIRVTFSEAMRPAEYSWSLTGATGGDFPPRSLPIDAGEYDAETHSFTFAVELEPATQYGFWLNLDEFEDIDDIVQSKEAMPGAIVWTKLTLREGEGFREESGLKALPYLLKFTTAPAVDPDRTEK